MAPRAPRGYFSFFHPADATRSSSRSLTPRFRFAVFLDGTEGVGRGVGTRLGGVEVSRNRGIEESIYR